MKKKHTIHVTIWIIMILGPAVPDIIRFRNLKSPPLNQEIQELQEFIADTPEDPQPLFWLGLVYHDLASRQELHPSFSIDTLRDSLKMGYEPETEAYLGSAYTLLGRDSFHPFLKLGTVWLGLYHMDRAVRQSPDTENLARVVRMNNNQELSGFFFRGRTVERDRKILSDHIQN